MSDVTRTEGTPHDRLTRISDAMLTTFDDHRDLAPHDRCIVFLEDDERGGIAIHRYEDDTAAIAAMFMHLRAMFRASGRDLQLIGIPNDVSGLDP